MDCNFIPGPHIINAQDKDQKTGGAHGPGTHPIHRKHCEDEAEKRKYYAGDIEVSVNQTDDQTDYGY
jgi:hypothetical protein